MDEAATTIGGTALLSESAALQWWEAVAVVLQVGETLRLIAQTGAAVAPDLPHVRLLANGTVGILPGAEGSDRPVTRLAGMLKALLQRAPAPPELARFVAQAIENPTDQDIDRFITTLHYFERPDRPQVLQAVFERVADVDAQARIAQELERLEAKLREAAVKPPSEPAPEPKRGRRRMALVVLIAVLIVAGASAVAWWRFRTPLTLAGSGVASIATRAGQGVSQAVTRGVERLFGQRAQEPAPDTTAAQPSAPPGASTRRARKGKAREASVDRAAAGAAATEAPVLVIPELPPTMLALPDAFLMPPTPDYGAPRPEPRDDRIYSRGDPDVTPPVPMQPLFGRPTTDTAAVAGDMDVLVDQRGTVERITLLVPNRYEDRVLIYAMKARRFSPAMLDGRPVRYLLRIRTAF